MKFVHPQGIKNLYLFSFDGIPWILYVNLRDNKACLIHDRGQVMHLELRSMTESEVSDLAGGIFEELYNHHFLSGEMN